MDITQLLKIIGVGVLSAVAGIALKKSEKEELAVLVSLCGTAICTVMLIGQFEALLETLRQVFGL